MCINRFHYMENIKVLFDIKGNFFFLLHILQLARISPVSVNLIP